MQSEPLAVETLQMKLVNLALCGLAPLYDDRQKLFAYRITPGQRTPMPLAWSITYTAITLLGLIKALHNGWQEIPVDVTETLDSLVTHIDRVARPGDLGLILWADALCEGRHQSTVLGAMKRQAHIETLARMTNMELAWLLTGLCYTHQRFGRSGDTENLASTIFEAIASNFNQNTGLFCHARAGAWLTGFRNQIGNFADQIYAVYALSTFYEVFGRPQALQWALQCANRLRILQGNQGQWWWHYDVRQGVVASRYPVFAVHQYGMAPMALFKLSAVSGQDFHPAITRGLMWLFDANELRKEIIDWDKFVTWRDIERTRPVAYLRYASIALLRLGWTNVARWLDAVPLYKLNREMRPYELGWLLYAFADQRSIHLHVPAKRKIIDGQNENLDRHGDFTSGSLSAPNSR